MCAAWSALSLVGQQRQQAWLMGMLAFAGEPRAQLVAHPAQCNIEMVVAVGGAARCCAHHPLFCMVSVQAEVACRRRDVSAPHPDKLDAMS